MREGAKYKKLWSSSLLNFRSRLIIRGFDLLIEYQTCAELAALHYDFSYKKNVYVFICNISGGQANGSEKYEINSNGNNSFTFLWVTYLMANIG
jgi:hypothetical protein